ncbi:Transcription factor CP2 [Cryptotermes secundus]|uniref:Transcription factor CP2 n=1 Tax=Cryptotermes secundus TaxID=105785 RepID=A0A2J7Q2R8_9NEOP|nr:upstream-binding protein 1 isoform X2 [Cryptotermes secundus]PNF22880.1 Transcription factor CP2 [Cryptotermes secundus]
MLQCWEILHNYSHQMRVLRGMEVQVILNDVAGIMDLHFPDNSPIETSTQVTVCNKEQVGNKDRTWSDPISPASSSNEIVSDDNGSDDLFSWPNELKLALDNVKNNLALAVNNTSASVSSGITVSGGRKRKMWDNADSPIAKVPTPPQNRQQMVVAEPLMVGDCTSDGSAKMITTLTHFKDNKDPLSEVSAPVVSGADQHRDRVKKGDSGSSASRMNSWQVEDIADNLAADLDGSLSGLGVDLSAAPYNMSEALLALPSLTVFKQEAPSPSSQNDAGLQQASPNPGVGEADSNTHTNNSSSKNVPVSKSSSSGGSSPLHQLLQHSTNAFSSNVSTTVLSSSPTQHLQLDSCGSVNQAIVGSTTNTHPVLSHVENFQPRNTGLVTTTSSLLNGSSAQQDLGVDCRFQYVLAAATSIATKVNEETLTYLNQGQSYEIKLKKLGELSAYRGKILKSMIRICFHERRLQYMEREQMAAWQASRPGDRIVEVDVPLSYGIYDVVQDQYLLNTVEFLWDPTKEVGVYIKVNCISTEFTPKKHGGEKGVPFRIQVETYLQGEGTLRRLHAAACQIKVFKLKGADRKHKQDREKILKRPPLEQEKFQPSYDCTVLNDIPTESLTPTPLSSAVTSTSPSAASFSPQQSDNHGSQQRGGRGTPTDSNSVAPVAIVTAKEERNSQPVVANLAALPAPATSAVLPEPQPLQTASDLPVYLQPLPSEATAQQTAQWLQSNRFGSYLRVFASFSGADILRLSRDDLIQICGLPDGIRLFNALHSKAIVPRLTLYLCVEQSSVYHALYLDSLSCAEMASKLAQLMGITADQIHDIYMQGPGGIHVLITDDVVRNIKDEAMFTIEILQDQSGERYRLLLKPASR